MKLAVNQVEAALAAVVAKNTGSICVNDALRDPYTSSVFDRGLQHRLKWHVSLRVPRQVRYWRVHSVLEGQKLLE